MTGVSIPTMRGGKVTKTVFMNRSSSEERGCDAVFVLFFSNIVYVKNLAKDSFRRFFLFKHNII